MKTLWRLAACAVMALALSGCGGGTGDTTVSDIRNAAVQLCGFLPTVETVVKITSASNAAVTGGTAVARAICDAAQATRDNKSLSPGGCQHGAVNGVCVEGEWQTSGSMDKEKSSP